jgi:hypothetical protein
MESGMFVKNTGCFAELMKRWSVRGELLRFASSITSLKFHILSFPDPTLLPFRYKHPFLLR